MTVTVWCPVLSLMPEQSSLPLVLASKGVLKKAQDSQVLVQLADSVSVHDLEQTSWSSTFKSRSRSPVQ